MPVFDPELVPFPLFRRGKVRDVFDLGDRLLIVATDRISAFDVVLPNPVPDKGSLLTGISSWWFDATESVWPNHRTGETVHDLGLGDDIAHSLEGRSTIARKAERVDVECVVRAHLAGSGWKEYSSHGTLAGEPLPSGLKRADRLPDLRFTPALKNDEGHDENVSRTDLGDQVGPALATELERASLALFAHAEPIARRAGFALADTKFEFGYIDGQLTLIDEIFTPDSSRYWDLATWTEGEEPPSFDKQPVRDWLESTGWNKHAPGPTVPADIIEATRSRYRDVFRRLQASSADPGAAK